MCGAGWVGDVYHHTMRRLGRFAVVAPRMVASTAVGRSPPVAAARQRQVRCVQPGAFAHERDLMVENRADYDAHPKYTAEIARRVQELEDLWGCDAPALHEAFGNLVDFVHKAEEHEKLSESADDPVRSLMLWGAYVHRHPDVVPFLMRVAEGRDLQATAQAARLLARSLHWLPDVVADLLAEHQLLARTLALCDRLHRDRAEYANSAFLNAMVLLNAALRPSGGVGVEALTEERNQLLERHDVLELWRSVMTEHWAQVRALPVSCVSYNSVLLEAVQGDEATLLRVTPADIKLVDKGLKLQKELEAKSATDATGLFDAWIARMDGLAAVAMLTDLRFRKEDFAFLTELKAQKWLVKFAVAVKNMKWTSVSTLRAQGQVMSLIFLACGGFALRWPLDVAQAGLVEAAVDKIRYGLGFLAEELKKAESAEDRSTLVAAHEPLFLSLTHFLATFCTGERLDMEYHQAAYNPDRLTPLRFGKVSAMLSRLLSLYPKSEDLMNTLPPILSLLMQFQEQPYDMKDAKILEAVLNVRKNIKDPVTRQKMATLTSRLQERVPQ